MPIIILEGIDGGGKSTLANHIARLSPLPATIIHRGPIKTSVVEELIDPLFEVEPDELLIADRWHLSELIYGPLYRGKSKISLVALHGIESHLQDRGAVRVVLQTPLEIVTARLQTRGEDFLQSNHHLLVHAAYRGLAEMLGYEIVDASDEATALTLIQLALVRGARR